MVWAILLLLGIPLWFVVVGIAVTIHRNRALRSRRGNVSVRLLRPGASRWTRGNAIWVSDVFVFYGSPAAWREDIVQVFSLAVREPTADEQHRLRRLGSDVQIVMLEVGDADHYAVAAPREHQRVLLGPFAAGTRRPEGEMPRVDQEPGPLKDSGLT